MLNWRYVLSVLLAWTGAQQGSTYTVQNDTLSTRTDCLVYSRSQRRRNSIRSSRISRKASFDMLETASPTMGICGITVASLKYVAHT